MPSNNDIYQAVTDRLIAAIEADGVAPWQKTWSFQAQAPRSMSSRKPYSGINTWLLLLAGDGYTSQWWGTYKQIAALGGQVRKGEKSTVVVFWKIMKRKNETTGKDETFPFLRTFNVFNADQADGLPERFHPAEPVETEPQVPEAHEAFRAYVAREGINEATGNPAYAPLSDTIYMPPMGSFTGEVEFLSTVFHEAGHSTGAKGRLDREIANVFGSHGYSREELVAEMTAAMLSAHFGFTTDRLQANQAAYLKNWLSALQEDPKMLVWAAARAQKAADMILGIVPETETEEEK